MNLTSRISQLLKAPTTPLNLTLLRTITSINLSSYAEYKTLLVSHPSPHVLHVQLNRPEQRNALNKRAFLELGQCFRDIAVDTDCRAVVLSGVGKSFCAGIDYFNSKLGAPPELKEGRDDIAGRSRELRYKLKQYQESISSLEKCTKPVIAAIHSACIGAGFAIATATDVRLATKDAFFGIREVDLGLACDLGTLQRLPKVIGNESVARQIAFSGGDLPAVKAERLGLLSELYDSQEKMLEEALKLAATIATKSPVAVQGTKYLMNYSRDHTVQNGLDYTAIWNSTMLQSEDVKIAVGKLREKSEEEVEFKNL